MITINIDEILIWIVIGIISTVIGGIILYFLTREKGKRISKTILNINNEFNNYFGDTAVLKIEPTIEKKFLEPIDEDYRLKKESLFINACSSELDNFIKVNSSESIYGWGLHRLLTSTASTGLQMFFSYLYALKKRDNRMREFINNALKNLEKFDEYKIIPEWVSRFERLFLCGYLEGIIIPVATKLLHQDIIMLKEQEVFSSFIRDIDEKHVGTFTPTEDLKISIVLVGIFEKDTVRYVKTIASCFEKDKSDIVIIGSYAFWRSSVKEIVSILKETYTNLEEYMRIQCVASDNLESFIKEKTFPAEYIYLKKK